ncbi:hypothetical protein [Microbispora sp. GKU 823]|uniref:hypothetical protein n=1 Tax=Microbispora sp. GKU 823 TaxID=1652100 RepID=UPI0009A2F36E|nr:hypothetical protein [Microbispora sp. GKU 823]OPG14092.1 hypothetical protein B1L11_04845 [Microbispora sp. GKU 823]
MATVTGASPAPKCPACSGPIALASTGRPSRYCGTPCRQAAHRARRQAGEAAEHLAWIRRRLATDVGRARQLADSLTAAAAAVVDVHQDQDGEVADDPVDEPAAGWEGELATLAHRLQVLAGQIAGAARDHERARRRPRSATPTSTSWAATPSRPPRLAEGLRQLGKIPALPDGGGVEEEKGPREYRSEI